MLFSDSKWWRKDNKMLSLVFILFLMAQSFALSYQSVDSQIIKHSQKHQIHRLQDLSQQVNAHQESFAQIKQAQCSEIKNSIPIWSVAKITTQCVCPKGTEKYQTKDGQKCLSPQPVEYPQFIDLACVFLAFFISGIVAYLCRHKEEVERNRNSFIRNDQNKQQTQKNQQLGGKVQRMINENLPTRRIDSEEFPRYASSIQSKYDRMKSSKGPMYASGTDLPQSRYQYAVARDISPMRSHENDRS